MLHINKWYSIYSSGAHSLCLFLTSISYDLRRCAVCPGLADFQVNAYTRDFFFLFRKWLWLEFSMQRGSDHASCLDPILSYGINVYSTWGKEKVHTELESNLCASVDIMDPQDVSLSNIAVILLRGELAVRGNCKLHTSGHAEEHLLSCLYSGESAAWSSLKNYSLVVVLVRI